MKKRLWAVLCAAALTLSLLSGCGAIIDTGTETESDADTGSTEGIQATPEFYAQADLSVLEGKKIGITLQSLGNAYWAGIKQAWEEVLEENGAQVTTLACNDRSATQIAQIESFISSGCDLIMVHPSDAAALEDICAEARSRGIKVMCWDDPMTNTDANWVLNNTDLGMVIGEAAGEFINEHYSGDAPAKVAMINYPQTKILLEREQGIRQGLEETCPGKYEIIFSQPGLDAKEAQDAMEVILQAEPDCKIVVGIGSGAMIGSDEALQISTGGDIPEDMGVFTADVTKQQLEQLKDPTYPARAVIGFEGSDEDTGRACAAMFAMILSDSIESQNVFRTLMQINAENVDDIMTGMK